MNNGKMRDRLFHRHFQPLNSKQQLRASDIGHISFDYSYFSDVRGLVNEIGGIYSKRLLEYADKQEIFDMKAYVYILRSISNHWYDNLRLNGRCTLDNIASCLFGIGINSLEKVFFLKFR